MIRNRKAERLATIYSRLVYFYGLMGEGKMPEEHVRANFLNQRSALYSLISRKSLSRRFPRMAERMSNMERNVLSDFS